MQRWLPWMVWVNGLRSSVSLGEANTITMLAEQHFPHSLGLLYSAFTYFTGFRVNSGEYKLMGLAPYGETEICATHTRYPSLT